MGLFDDRLRIIDVGAAEDDMRNGHQQRGFVDCIQQSLDGDGNAVISLYHVDACTILPLRFPEIHDRGKIHVAVHDLVALAGEVEARGYDCLTRRYVLMSVRRDCQPVSRRATMISTNPRTEPHAPRGERMGKAASWSAESRWRNFTCAASETSQANNKPASAAPRMETNASSGAHFSSTNATTIP